MQGSQPVENLLNACGVQRRSVRYRGCWTPPPAACQTPRRPSPKAPSMGADLDRTSACARTMLGIFEPECRVPGLRQSAAALLRQISLGGPIWTGHSRSPPPLLRRRPPGWLGAPYGARASLPFGATLRGSPAGAGKGLRPFDPPLRPALGRRSRAAGSPVLVSWRRAKAAAAEVEHERTRQVARIGNNLNQIARWANTFASTAEAVEIVTGLGSTERLESRLKWIRDAPPVM